MCDWGGGPNQLYNYLDDRPYKPEPKSVYCQSLIRDAKGHLHGCQTLIEGFTASMTYTFYTDPVVHKHFDEVEHYKPLEEHYGYKS